MMFQSLHCAVAVALAFTLGADGATVRRASAPTVKTVNGTYQGLNNAEYNQDYFLGIPYAQPPVGNLRLNLPQAITTSFSGIRKAVKSYPDCPPGGGVDDDFPGITISEDCLALNVIRPAGTKPNAGLPVAFWIYGGGFYNGGSADPRYNMSFVVKNSMTMGTPVITVQLNYRVTAFGFLYSKEIQQAGVTNLGLRDQRLALQWVQENIAAFGGDPSKVTIWGESAGASSVGYHTTAYGGRDDKLFRAAIAESGGPLSSAEPNATSTQTSYDAIVKAVGCTTASNTLTCIRKAPYMKFYNAIKSLVNSSSFSPVVDGDFLIESTSTLLDSGRFVKVPLLIGANTAEGSAFGPQGINNDTAMTQWLLEQGMDATTAANTLLLYPDIPALGVPPTYIGRPNSTFGTQYHRAAAIGGDITMHRGRRFSATAWATHGTPCYSYRFNVFPLGGVTNLVGTVHFQEVAFVFDNEMGLGYVPPHAPTSEYNVSMSLQTSYVELGKVMSGMWINFFDHMDPNPAAGKAEMTVRNGETVPMWPVYAEGGMLATEGYGRNFVVDVNVTGFGMVEDDTYRGPGIAYLNTPTVQMQLGS